jgi:hypothetical protein
MDLTEAEQWSLTMAPDDEGRRVRMVYFATKRCPECTEQRSCWTHLKMMTEGKWPDDE